MSTPYRFPSSLMTSVPDHRTNPSLCPGTSLSSYSDKVRALGLYSVTCWTAPLSPVYLCNYFFKNRITCGCHPLPQP